jgi:hypothetical protein
MSRNIIGDERTRRSIVSVLRTVNELLPIDPAKDRLSCENGNRTVIIDSGRKHVPDFVFKWCDQQGHYRVYLKVAFSKDDDKITMGLCMMSVPNKLAASEFVIMFQTILKNRANRKS